MRKNPNEPPNYIAQMIGKKYHRLTVDSYNGRYVSMTSNSKSYRHMLNCTCECGNTLVARADSIRKGGKKSCGCLKREANVGFKNPKYQLVFGKKER